MTEKQQTSVFQWIRFIVGAVYFAGIVAVHVAVQPFSDIVFVALLAIPGALIGVERGGKK